MKGMRTDWGGMEVGREGGREKKREADNWKDKENQESGR